MYALTSSTFQLFRNALERSVSQYVILLSLGLGAVQGTVASRTLHHRYLRTLVKRLADRLAPLFHLSSSAVEPF